MRRDHFTLTVDEAGAVAPPAIVVTYEGPAGTLTSRLTEDDEILEDDMVDPSFRRRPLDSEELDEVTEEGAGESGTGVFSLTHRVTGEYILEAVADTAAVKSLIDAARAEGGSYRVRIERPSVEDVVFVTDTLLVYDVDGNLLRKDSLIPSGVEL